MSGRYLSDADAIDGILSFLSESVALNEIQVQVVRQVTRITRYPKGAILLAQGEIARENWLVVKGCVRAFNRTEAGERTLDFLTEFQAAIPPTYGTDAPSPVSFECLENVVASSGTPDEDAAALAAHPSFEWICRVMGELLMSRMQIAHIDTLTRTAEQRYRDLATRRPDLLQRVAQYHLASWLGVQPETLSRIRRRLARRSPFIS